MTSSYLFVARETAVGRVRIELEVQGEALLPILDHGTIAFDVRPGTTLETAEAITHLLNRDIVGVTYIEGTEEGGK
jgi:hypothetical protein